MASQLAQGGVVWRWLGLCLVILRHLSLLWGSANCLGPSRATLSGSGLVLATHYLLFAFMTVRREALRAFYHQVGYAVLRLRQDFPVVSAELLPTVHELQNRTVQISPKGCSERLRWQVPS